MASNRKFITSLFILIALIALSKAQYGHYAANLTRNQNLFSFDLDPVNKTSQLTINFAISTPVTAYLVYFYSDTATADDFTNRANLLQTGFSVKIKNTTHLIYTLTAPAPSKKIIFQLVLNPAYTVPKNTYYLYGITFQNNFNKISTSNLRYNLTASYQNYYYNILISNTETCNLQFTFTCFNCTNLGQMGSFQFYAPGATVPKFVHVGPYANFQKVMFAFDVAGIWKMKWQPSQLANSVFLNTSRIAIDVTSPLDHPQIPITQFCYNKCTQPTITYPNLLGLPIKTGYWAYNGNIDLCPTFNSPTFNSNPQTGYPYTNCTYYLATRPTNKDFIYDKDKCLCNLTTQAFVRLSIYSSICTDQCYKLLRVNPTDTKTVSQGCDCIDGFKWNSIQRYCQIDCAQFSGATDTPTYYNSTTCLCQNSKYRWNANSFKCVLDCTVIPGSSAHILYPSYSDIEPLSCPCLQNYIWNSTTIQCQPKRDCSVYQHTNTQILASNVNQCVCINGYQWNSNQLKCRRKCSIIQHTNLNIISINPQDCQCNIGYSWNRTQAQCRRKCSQIPNTIIDNNYYLVSNEYCVCQQGFYWSQSQQGCRRDCGLICKNDGQTHVDTNIVSSKLDQCICLDNFVWSNDQINCRRVCTGDINADQSQIAVSINQCVCKQGYIWSSTLNKCIVNCLLIDNIDTLQVSLSSQVCPCSSGFEWKSDGLVCRRVCSSLTNVNTNQVASNPNECVCNSGFSWSSSEIVCRRDCSAISNVDSTEITVDPTQCVCASGYIWSSTLNKCIVNCLLIANVNSAQVSLSSQVCPCSAGFEWKSDALVCRRVCSSLSNTNTALVASDPAQCVCASGFSWSVSQNVCRRVCSSISHADQNSISKDPTKCACSNSYSWDSTRLTCVQSCGNIPFASSISSTDLSICNCQMGYTWDTIQSRCLTDCDHGFYWNATLSKCRPVPSQNGNGNGKLASSSHLESSSDNLETISNNNQQNKPSNTVLIVLLSIFGAIILILLIIIIFYQCKNNTVKQPEQKIEEQRCDTKKQIHQTDIISVETDVVQMK